MTIPTPKLCAVVFIMALVAGGIIGFYFKMKGQEDDKDT